MLLFFFVNKKFKDTKGVIRNCKLKNRQYTGQKKKEKSTNNDLQNTTQKNIDLSKTKATKKKKRIKKKKKKKNTKGVIRTYMLFESNQTSLSGDQGYSYICVRFSSSGYCIKSVKYTPRTSVRQFKR